MKTRTLSSLCGGLLALALLYGCSGAPAAPISKAPHQRLLVILFDATASFTPEWPHAVEKAAGAIKELNPGDAVLCIAITDRGWQSRDVLVPYTRISPVTLRAFHDRAALAKRVRALTQPDWTSGHVMNGHPAGKPKGTDLAGAVDYADYLSQQSANASVAVVIFSDFEDEAPKGYTTTRKLPEAWPQWTHLYGMQVRADKRGGAVTQQRIQRWCDLFNSLRAPNAEPVCTPNDFHLIGTDNEVTGFFDWTRR